jgi:hypothetical protein
LLNHRVDRGECQIGYFELLGPVTALYPNGMFVEGRVISGGRVVGTGCVRSDGRM